MSRRTLSAVLMPSTLLHAGPVLVVGHDVTVAEGAPDSVTGGRGVFLDFITGISPFNLEIICFVLAFLVIRWSVTSSGLGRPDKGHKIKGKGLPETKASDELVAELAKVSSEGGKVEELLQRSLEGKKPLSQEALVQFAEHALLTENFGLASQLETLFKDKQGIDFPTRAAEPLLKLWVRVDSSKPCELFKDFVAAGHEFTEDFCRFMMARCSDIHQTALADELAKFLRARDAMSFLCYKTLMKVYSIHGRANKACELYKEIKAKGWALDSIMLASLIKLATIANRSDLIQEFRGLVSGTSASCYLLMVRALGQEGDVDGAFDLFHRTFKECHEPIELVAYNMMIDVFVANKELTRAYKVLDEMCEAGHVPTLVTYNTLIKGHCAVDDIVGGVGLLDRIDAAGLTPDSVTFRSLLCCATKATDCKSVLSILRRMEAMHARLDMHNTVMLLQFARRCTLQQAQQLLASIDKIGNAIFNDLLMFNAFVDVCVVHRDQRRLAQLLDGFDKSNLIPDLRTYGLLIKANAVLHRTQGSLDCWQALVEDKRLQPNDVALGCIIDALVESHRVDDALRLFQTWKKKVPCDTIIYSTLIKGFTTIGDVTRAMALYEDMKANRIALNAIVYSTLINANAKDGNVPASEKLLEEMSREGTVPNAFTYSSMIRGYSLQKNLEAAQRMYRMALAKGFETNAVIYNTMLDGCIQSNEWKLADKVLAEFYASGTVGSNYTVSILVKMWSKRGNLDKAFAALKMAHDGRRIDSQVGACIIGACLHNRAAGRALEIYYEMTTWKNFEGVDANAYGALIGGLVRQGYVEEAVCVTQEACNALKVKPGYDKKPLAPAAIKQLFQALRQRGLTAHVGRPLARRLQEAGTIVNPNLLN